MNRVIDLKKNVLEVAKKISSKKDYIFNKKNNNELKVGIDFLKMKN